MHFSMLFDDRQGNSSLQAGLFNKILSIILKLRQTKNLIKTMQILLKLMMLIINNLIINATKLLTKLRLMKRAGGCRDIMQNFC